MVCSPEEFVVLAFNAAPVVKRVGRQGLLATSFYLGLTSLCGMASGVALARALGPGTRGQLALIVAVASIFAVALPLGVDTSIRILLPRSVQADLERANYVWWARNVLVLAMLVTAIGVYALWSAGTIETPLEYGAASAYILLLVCFALSKGAVRAEGHIARVEAVGAATVAVQLAAVGSLWWWGNSELAFYIAALALGISVGTLVLIAQLRHWPTNRRWKDSSLLKTGGVTQIGILSMALTYRVDRLILAWVASVPEVGIYVVAVSISESLLLFATAGSQLIIDRYSRVVNQTIGRKVTGLEISVISVTGVGAVGVFVFAGSIVHLLFGDAYAPAAQPLRILAVASLIASVWRVLGSRLIGLGGARSYAVCGATALVVAVGAGVPLMHWYGAVGAAYASVFSYAAAAGIAGIMLTVSKS